MNKLKKLGIAALMTVALGIGFEFDAHKYMIRNIMSHHPVGYSLDRMILNLPKFIFTKDNYSYKGYPQYDLSAICLGLEENPFKESKYKPTSLTYTSDQKFYSPGNSLIIQPSLSAFKEIEPTLLRQILEMKKGDIISLPQDVDKEDYNNFGIFSYDFYSLAPFGNCTLSIGKDENGYYLSFYDVWDFSDDSGYFKISGKITDRIGSKIIPLLWKPLHFYERFYFKDYGITEEILKEMYGEKTKTLEGNMVIKSE